jgi:hypothetical protein
MFCALAFLKTAQKFDSYLAALGLSVSQSGSGMVMEMLLGMRILTGLAYGGARTAGSMFGGGSPASGTGGPSGGLMAGLANRFTGNSYVRDAVVDGGTRMGAGGSIGFVGRAFGGIAARGGAELTGNSISSVASRTAAVSGSIAGDIADRSIRNYLPNMPEGARFSNTQITGGHISTVAASQDGRTSAVDLYSAAQFTRPESPHSVVTAQDGSEWYQIASGEGMDAFYAVPRFSGDASEAGQASELFPNMAEGTALRSIDSGTIEASRPDGNSLWLNSAFYREPEAPHDTFSDANGTGWYAMRPHASIPEFEGAIGTQSEAALDYNRAQFTQFMPGYETSVSQVDASRSAEGILEVRHQDGSGTEFYDRTIYRQPSGEHRVFEDRRGNEWYAVPGSASVERRPVYEEGRPVYDGDTLRTVNVESVKYKPSPSRHREPARRDVNDRNPPPRRR